MSIRYQLPAYSPVSVAAICKALITSTQTEEQIYSYLVDSIKNVLSADPVLLTGSGTQALTLGIRLAQATMEKALPIALPAYSCYDLATAAAGADVPVRFYDVDPDTLTPDEESIDRALCAGVSVLVASNLFGFPLNWTALADRCERDGVILIEDAAQGLGTTWSGRPGGAFGDMTILSFGRGKGWTGGGGGALIFRGNTREWLDWRKQPRQPRRTESLHSLFTTLAQWFFGRPLLFGIPTSVPGLGLGETRYKEPVPPTRICRFSAALARQTRALAFKEVETRKKNADRWKTLVSRIEGDLPFRLLGPITKGEASFLRFPALLGPAASSLPFLRPWRKFGIRRGYPLMLPDLPAMASRNMAPGTGFPGARVLAERLITLPTHSLLTDLDFNRVAAFLSEVI